MCLGLDYDRFAAAPHIFDAPEHSVFLPPLLPYSLIASRQKVVAAADAGCNLCRVLAAGILHFWKDQAPNDFKPHPPPAEYQDNDGDGEEGNGEEIEEDDEGNAGGAQDREDTDQIQEGGGRVSPRSYYTRRLYQGVAKMSSDHVCITLRPGRSLRVSWIGYLLSGWELASSAVQARPDFYIDAGLRC